MVDGCFGGRASHISYVLLAPQIETEGGLRTPHLGQEMTNRAVRHADTRFLAETNLDKKPRVCIDIWITLEFQTRPQDDILPGIPIE